MSTVEQDASVAYDELLDHGASCVDCRALRNEDGKSTGMCPEGDRLTLAHRRAIKHAHEGSSR